MAKFSQEDHLRSGLPLGGLGTGTLEVFSDGTRGAFTGLNNWGKPLGQIHNFRSGPFGDYRAGHPFALLADNGHSRFTGLLQTVPTGGCTTVTSVTMEGLFPVAQLTFAAPVLPAEVRMTAFSPFIPGEPADSGFPVALYRLEIHNPGSQPVRGAVMATAVNCVGEWNVGRYNTVVRQDGLTGVVFRKDRASCRDERDGTIALMTPDLPGVTACGSWPYITRCFRDLAPGDLRLPGWDEFRRTGLLPRGQGDARIEGEFGEWIAGLGHAFYIAAGATETVDFVYAWHAPNHLYGHHYQNRFADAWQAGRAALERRNGLFERTTRWQSEIMTSGLPDWLADGLINNLYPLTAASWWVKDGRFAELECPTHHPLLGTLDVHYYGSIPLALLFPELEKNMLRQFAAYQYADGYIPHDLGKDQLDCPSAGTSAGPRWKDLCPKFVLLVYRNYLWWKDTDYLKEMYPAVKQAIEWQAGADRDGDGLPENEGMDSTFDNWDMHGVTPYVAGIYLAALRAAEECARLADDEPFAALCARRFARGSARFDEMLFNGRFFRAIVGPDGVSEECTACQLNGQWYAHMLRLGDIATREYIHAAVRAVLDLNAAASDYGAVNSVSPYGQATVEDDVNHQAGNIWPGETYALAALAVYEGFVEEGLALARKTYENMVRSGFLWNQPDVVQANDGQPYFGDDYERNMCIWSLLHALSLHDSSAAELWQKLIERSQVYAEGAGGR